MEKQLRKLRLITRVFPVKWFYSVSVTDSRISLQGYYKPEIAEQIKKFMTLEISGQGYVQGDRNNIYISLT